MPMIDLTMPAGAVEPDAARRLTDELAASLLRWEGAPDTEFFREITWVYLHEVAPGRIAPGGRPGGEARFRVDVTVPRGTLSQRRKDGLAADLHHAVATAAGFDPEGPRALHVWTLVHEVDEGNWAAGGHTVRFAELRAAAHAEQPAAPPAAG